MTAVLFYKLLAIFIAAGMGWFVGHMRWLGKAGGDNDPARVLSNLAFYLFVPALMFRTTARVDFATLPWLTVAAFFVPVVLMLIGVYLWQRARHPDNPAVPAVRSITATFGNTLQVGVPLVAGVFGEDGLAVHITIVSLHALTLLTIATVLVESDLARHHRSGASLWGMVLVTVRNTVIHPVVLPVLAGFAWNLTGLGLPTVLDEVLQMLGSAVVPLCLVLIGMSLSYYGWPKAWREMSSLIVLKLLALPALVLVIAHWGFGLSGMGLSVIVMMAALPPGSNAMMFAQRYRTLEGEASGAVVVATMLFALTAPLWLAVPVWLSRWA
ncbi:AEC family transporter [Roseateles amylovorans]|jgi:malonate transporter and related proteins|uniref:AEC family transporter n=1 Tax=Roseateles amylovorans TaxID=2978473 RepID=A0ABY6AZN5_9BURK|nr:AEC family transporter [Roseateles amylovorans]UXH78045.1 AEC family transporter [Roseateles amylovorans]